MTPLETLNCNQTKHNHYDDVIMTTLASQITSLTVVYSIVYSGVNQRKHQSSASLAFVREIHRGPVNFPHKWPVTRKMFPFDDVIMSNHVITICNILWSRVSALDLWLFYIIPLINHNKPSVKYSDHKGRHVFVWLMVIFYHFCDLHEAIERKWWIKSSEILQHCVK